MPSAGPSAALRDTEHHTPRSPETETQRRKRRRITGIEDVFERQDPEEKASIGQGYREMQMEADGMSRLAATSIGLAITSTLRRYEGEPRERHGEAVEG